MKRWNETLSLYFSLFFLFQRSFENDLCVKHEIPTNFLTPLIFHRQNSTPLICKTIFHSNSRGQARKIPKNIFHEKARFQPNLVPPTWDHSGYFVPFVQWNSYSPPCVGMSHQHPAFICHLEVVSEQSTAGSAAESLLIKGHTIDEW